MANQYSPKQFFRKVSNRFLFDYFEQSDVVLDADLLAIYDHEVELIFDAFLKLADQVRHDIELDFQQINALATDAGIIALIEEAKEFDNFHFIDTIKTIDGEYNKVMWAFLDSPEYWQTATTFFHTNSIPSSAWKKDIRDIHYNHYQYQHVSAFDLKLNHYLRRILLLSSAGTKAWQNVHQ